MAATSPATVAPCLREVDRRLRLTADLAGGCPISASGAAWCTIWRA